MDDEIRYCWICEGQDIVYTDVLDLDWCAKCYEDWYVNMRYGADAEQ